MYNQDQFPKNKTTHFLIKNKRFKIDFKMLTMVLLEEQVVARLIDSMVNQINQPQTNM